MARDMIELRNGTVLPLASLTQQMTIFAFQSRLHIDVCERLAEDGGFYGIEKKIYVNQLRVNSRKAKCITALIMLLERNKIDVKAIYSHFISENFRDFIGGNIEIHRQDSYDRSLLDPIHIIRFLIKVFCHNLFRLFSLNRRGPFSIVRAWMENSERIFSDVFWDSQVLIYPLYFDFSRQLKYLWQNRSKHPYLSLMGLPYSWISALELMCRPRERDRIIVTAEKAAYEKHAHELLTRGAKIIYAADEFELAGVAMYEELRRHGVKVLGRTHALSFMSPYIGYSEHQVYNLKQKEYYSYRNQQLKFRPIYLRTRSPNDKMRYSDYFNPIVVVLDQTFRQIAWAKYEAKHFDKWIYLVYKVCSGIGVPFYIKLHPGANLKSIIMLRRKFGKRVIRNLCDLEAGHPIFLTWVSTVYYDFLEDGPVLFFSEESFSLKSFYGENISVVEDNLLEEELKALVSESTWHSRLEEQIVNYRREVAKIEQN